MGFQVLLSLKLLDFFCLLAVRSVDELCILGLSDKKT